MDDKKKSKLNMMLAEIQQEWERNTSDHLAMQDKPRGIKSSQISALVSVLIDHGLFEDSFNRRREELIKTLKELKREGIL